MVRVATVRRPASTQSEYECPDVMDQGAIYEETEMDDVGGTYEGLQARRDDQSRSAVYQRLAKDPARGSAYPPPTTNRPRAAARK